MTEDSVEATSQSQTKLSISQTITFGGNEDYSCEDITAQNVVINSNAGGHDHGCSKVKFKNIVDYNWECKMYSGQLLAVHIDGKFLAYSLKAVSQPNSGKPVGLVRVAHRSTQKRALLKGMQGQVQDLSFAYITAQVLLGCIDDEGNVFIHKIILEADGIVHSLLLHVVITPVVGSEHRILWCPYIPDVDDVDGDADDDSSKLLLAIQGNKAYIWNVGLVTSRFGEGQYALSEISECYLCIEDHTQPIVDAAFSPDGTSLATASCDGFVMFFQLYLNSDTPKCLYKWSPHDGKPLSSIFFLDNRNSTEQFWKYVVTGAEKNSVLKIWSCQTWGCLQTIIFAPHPKYSTIALKAGLDHSAKYLLLSDIHRRALFILHFDQNGDENGAVYCKKITEFYLTHSILCFGIVDAKLKRLKCPSSCPDVYHQSNEYRSPSESPIEVKEDNEENHQDDSISNGHEVDISNPEGCNVSAVVRLYLIQPNRLQEGYITFSPIKTGNRLIDKAIDITNLTNDMTLGYKEGLTDMSIDVTHDKSTLTLMGSPDKESQFTVNDEDVSLSDAQQPLNTILVQQSQQLKNLLMRSSQMGTSGFVKIPTSPPGPLSISNRTFAPLLPHLPTSSGSSSQPPLNLMTPDAFSSAKLDEEDPPISASPEVLLLALDNETHLNNIVADSSPSKALNIRQINPEAILVQCSTGGKVFVGDQSQSIADPGKFASGGSSPSREVQEILSVKGSDCYFEDEFDTEMNGQTPKNEREDLANDQPKSPRATKEMIRQALFGNPSDPGFQKIRISPYKPSKLNSSGFNEATDPIAWPSINIADINKTNLHQSNDNNDKSNAHSKSNSVNLSTAVERALENDTGDKSILENNKTNNRLSLSPIQNSDMKSIISKLDKFTALIYDQQKEISTLKGEICTLRRISQNTVEDNNSVVKILEQSLIKNQAQMKQLIDGAIASRADADRVNRETLLSGVSQIVGVQMTEKLNAAVSHETRHTLAPIMERILEPVARSLQLELSRKLTATDHLLTENIQKMVNSKSVMDNLCLAIATSLTNSTKDAFKQSIQTSLIPHLEKAQSQMFKQLNQSFSSGTKEYLSAFDNCTKRTIENATSIDESITKVKSVAAQLQTALDHQNKNNTINSQTQQAIKQLNNLTKELQNIIPNTLQGALENQLSPIKECIREQITSGMAAHAVQLEDCVLSAVRSGAQTPAPSIVGVQAQQQHIDCLLHNSQPNSAFQYALNASDLKLVVYACTVADPRRIFCTPCPLQQNVLLSLIQQLSADMTNDTQLKCSYLSEAVMYLDKENPLTKEHMPRVLKEMQKQLSSYYSSNPQNPSGCQIRLLLLATESLLKLSL